MPDIDSLSGRDLDAAVAERVMGCHWEGRRLLDAKGDCQFYRDQNGGIQANMEGNAFSSDWSAAALVAERMREMGWRFFNTNWYPNGEWGALFEDPTKHPGGAVGPTMPTAVCRAALMAREAKHG